MPKSNVITLDCIPTVKSPKKRNMLAPAPMNANILLICSFLGIDKDKIRTASITVLLPAFWVTPKRPIAIIENTNATIGHILSP